VLAAKRRASKDRPQATHLTVLAAILRDAAQDVRLLRMTAELVGETVFLIILYVN
jgi:hypothetical protein